MERRNKWIFGLVVIFYVFLIMLVVYFYFHYRKLNNGLRFDIANVDVSDFVGDESIDSEILFYQNIDDEIVNMYNEYYSNIALLEQKIMNGESSVHIAYLTFDDGPYDLTLRYLDILKRNNIRATFFCLGKDGFDDTYRRIVSEGHTLANHTFYHNISSGLYDSVDSFIGQVKKLEDYLYNITGFRTSIVRFPGGSSTAREHRDGIINELHNMGYNYVDWTSETGDGSSLKLALKDTYSWYLDTTRDKNIIVLLMHDYNYSTYNDLERIIGDLRNRGFIFLPLHNKSVMVK